MGKLGLILLVVRGLSREKVLGLVLEILRSYEEEEEERGERWRMVVWKVVKGLGLVVGLKL